MRWTEEDLARHECKDGFQRVIEKHGFVPYEDVEQTALARYLDLLGVRWAHIPNGGARNVVVGKKLKAHGVKPGVPDCLIFDAPPLHPCAPGVAIELKRIKGGNVSAEQKDWLQALSDRGWITKVCKGAGEAVDFLKSVGWGK